MDYAEEAVKCSVCRNGETSAGRATVILERGRTTLVFKDVPAQVCTNCGESFHCDEVTRALLSQAEEAARTGVEVDVRQFAPL
jgi:YgiT-type zinc finger domain-containing protein